MRQQFLDYLAADRSVDPSALASLGDFLKNPKEPIGRIAYMSGLLSASDIERILEHQRQEHRPFGEIAISCGMLDELQVERLLFIQRLRQVFELLEASILSGLVPRREAVEHMAKFLLQDADLQYCAAGSP